MMDRHHMLLMMMRCGCACGMCALIWRAPAPRVVHVRCVRAVRRWMFARVRDRVLETLLGRRSDCSCHHESWKKRRGITNRGMLSEMRLCDLCVRTCVLLARVAHGRARLLPPQPCLHVSISYVYISECGIKIPTYTSDGFCHTHNAQARTDARLSRDTLVSLLLSNSVLYIRSRIGGARPFRSAPRASREKYIIYL